MNRRLRRFCQIGAALLLVLGAAVTLVLWRGGEILRTTLEAQLQARLVPTLRLGAPLQWRLYPQPQVIVRDVSLADGAGTTVATLAELSVTLDGAGLTEGRLDVAAVDIDGLELTLVRDAEGGWDAAGWLRAAPDGAAAAPVVTIGRIRLAHGRVRMVDAAGTDIGELSEIELDMAPLRLGGQGEFSLAARADVPSAEASDVRIDAAGQFLADLDGPRLEQLRLQAVGEIGAWSVSRAEAHAARMEFGADGGLHASALTFDLAVQGEAMQAEAQVALAALSGKAANWRGEALDARLRGEQAGRGASVSLRAAEVHVDPNRWALPALALQAASTGNAPAASLSLQGAARFDGTTGASQLAVTVREALGSVPHPADAAATLELKWSGSVRYDPASGGAAGEMAGRFDQSRFEGRWSFDPRASTPIEISASLDRLDLDRYLPPARADANAVPADPPDLAMWRNWPVSADLRVGELRVRGIVSQQARVRLGGDGATDGR